MNMSSNNAEAMESLVNLPTYTAGVAQATAYRLLKKFTEDCISAHDLSMMQWYTIGTVYEAGEAGISVGDLASALDTGLPYITTTINVLEARGIVDRTTTKEDNRSKRIVLKKSYVPTVKKIEADMRLKMQATLYKDITPAELLTYIKVLYKLNALLDAA